MSKKEILIVEDESSIADTLIYALDKEGFLPTRVADLSSARLELSKKTFNAIVLDVGLPDGSGFDLCKEIRKSGDIPILFLTARNDEIDKIVGLEIGADDYVTKPFSPREVCARLKAILRRRSGNQLAKSDNQTQSGEGHQFLIENEKRRISFQGQPLDLSRYEFGILSLLLTRPGQVYSRQQIMNHVWESPDMSLERTVDTHIKTIRGKIKAICGNGDILITHRGVGYSVKEL